MQKEVNALRAPLLALPLVCQRATPERKRLWSALRASPAYGLLWSTRICLNTFTKSKTYVACVACIACIACVACVACVACRYASNLYKRVQGRNIYCIYMKFLKTRSGDFVGTPPRVHNIRETRGAGPARVYRSLRFQTYRHPELLIVGTFFIQPMNTKALK